MDNIASCFICLTRAVSNYRWFPIVRLHDNFACLMLVRIDTGRLRSSDMAPFPNFIRVLVINTAKIMSLYRSSLISHPMSLVLLLGPFLLFQSGGRHAFAYPRYIITPAGHLTVPRTQSSLHWKSRSILYL